MLKPTDPCPLWLVHVCSVRLLAFGLASGFMRLACSLAIAASMLLGGCAGLPHAVDRPDSRAIADAAPTTLSAIAAASLPNDAADRTGLRLLPDGSQALEARLALAAVAEKSIDAQYYQIADDASGRDFLAALSAAAARGVRVRLIVDDLHAVGQDALLAGLAARPGMEVRMFNPFAVRAGGVGSRVLWSLHDFSRVNRRMHNKLFIVDNAFAISGGRNIADEYFGRNQPAHFIDLDVLSAGPAVPSMSAAFDAYWNSEAAYPIQSLVRAAATPPRQPVVAVPQKVAPLDALGQGTVGAQLAARRVELHPALVQVLADAPGRPVGTTRAESVVMARSLALLGAAQSDVLIASPYFVPNGRTMQVFQRTSESRVPVEIITNSLATTDEPLVQFCYARHRRALLALGVGLFELMPEPGDRPAALPGRGSLGRLHAKLAVVDQRWLSIGSMNMDARSAHTNTEMILIADSPLLAGQARLLLRGDRQLNLYQVRNAAEHAGLQWVGPAGADQPVLNAEPDAHWASQLRMTLTSMVVGEDLL